MNKAEAKFHNTARKMHNALFQLLDGHEFFDISVSEICAAAGVNRSTFYAHYDNTLDLLKETQKEFVEGFFATYDKSFDRIDDISAKDSVFITPQYLIPYLEFVKKNKKLFKIYMKNLNNFDSNGIFDAMVDRLFTPVLRKHGIEDPVLISYMAQYYLVGITAITMRWLDRDCIDDIAFITEIIILCTRPEIK